MKVLWLMLFVVVILSCFVSAWNSTLDLGLQAYWNFDTNANDITENGNNCNNVGADYYASGGILSGFYNFTGVDYMNCGNSSKLRSNITFSYSIWVRPKDLSVDMMAISYPYSRGWYNPYGSWYLNFDENTLRTSTAVNGVPHYADIPNIAQANVWQHIAFTYDGNTIKLYYNGVNVVSTSVSGVILYNEADLSNLSIGTKSINALGMYWIGGIDEIGIWNRSLSSEEVSLLYNNGSGITYTGIECYADEDCGQDGWIDGEFCYNDDILQIYRTYTCNNPGTSSSSCSYNDSLQLKQDCGEDYCEEFGENYCFDGDVYHSRECHGFSCVEGSCFNSSYIKEQKVEGCVYGCENGECIFINIFSPIENYFYSTKSILLNVSLAEQVKNLYYKINSGSYSKLCIGCNKYAGTKSFSEGQNNLTIRAVTNTNQTYLSSITFNTDTIKPKISSTYPSTSYGSGLFGVKYIEANLKNVTLFYGLNSANPEKKKELIGCSSGTNMWCYNNVDLSAYNGKYIYYKFEVRDNFFSVNSSARKILVDTIKPIMNVNKPENNTVYINKDGKVYINITSNEKSKLEYKDNNLAWISLCSSCIYYRNYKTFSFGQHNVSFKATDLAGNYDEKSVSFKLQQY